MKSYGMTQHIFRASLMIVLSVFFLLSNFALASDSPVGKWRSIDDKTGKPKSIIEIYEVNGGFEGKVIELLNPSKPNPLCDKCKGDKANQPITGMVILWGVTPNDDGESWGGGKILDPKKGKEYKVKLSLQEGGNELKVRGYIGTPILGRTQVWERQAN